MCTFELWRQYEFLNSCVLFRKNRIGLSSSALTIPQKCFSKKNKKKNEKKRRKNGRFFAKKTHLFFRRKTAVFGRKPLFPCRKPQVSCGQLPRATACRGRYLPLYRGGASPPCKGEVLPPPLCRGGTWPRNGPNPLIRPNPERIRQK